MKKIRIAINGFGRIGRISTRVLLENSNLELVAVNDLADAATLAHLFKYDSIHRKYKGTVTSGDRTIIIDGKSIPVFSEKNPVNLPWKDLNIDVVLECTGKFTDKDGAEQHIKAGAKRVIISGPTKGKSDIKTIVLGVNDELLSSNENAFVTTVHSYTGDQNIHDAPHKDLRRARAAAVSIIPTTTGAAKALGDVLPHLNGKLGGAGIRIPAPDGSLTDITCILKEKVTLELINSTFKKYAENEMKGILEYTEDPIVSIDIIGNPNSCIFDSLLTTVLDKMVKVVGWYDNEAGYSNRLVELSEKVGRLIDK